MNRDRYVLLYPERRIVSGDWIRLTFSDLVADGDVQLDDDATTDDYDTDAMATLLSNYGHITLGKGT